MGIAFFALYAFTACPTIFWKDSAEFVAVAHFLDVAHPAGSPAYALLAKLLSLAPISDIAGRVNLFSSLTAAAAVALLFLLCRETLLAAGVRAGWTGPLAAGAAAAFGLGAPFWVLAATAEVYPLATCFFVGVLALLLRWDRTRNGGAGDLRLLAAAALLYGVGGGAHAALVFIAPAIAAFLIATLRGALLRPRVAATLAVAALLGVSVYLYLPLRSSSEGLVYDWGNPESWRGFLDHILVRKDAGVIQSLNVAQLPKQGAAFAGFAAEQLTWLALPLAGIGLFALAGRAGAATLLTGGAFALYVGFFIRYWTTPDIYMPGFALLAVWGAVGAAALAEGLERFVPRLRPRWVGAGAAALLVWHGAAGLARADRSEARGAYALAAESFLGLPEGALVFPVWQWFQAVYLQEVEGRRPDLQIMATTELKRPEWFRATADRKRFPDLRLPEGVPLHADNFARYMPALINANIGERRVFIETDQDTDEPLQGHLAPAGFLFEVLPDDEAAAHPTDLVSYFRDLRAFLEAEIERPEFFEDRGAAQTYSCLASSVGLHLLRSGRPPAAIALFELSRLMDPMSTDSVALIGAARHAMNDLEGAERALREAVALAPYRAFPRVTLGNVLLDRGRWAEADALFAAVLEREPENAKALLGRGYAAMEQGETARADGFVRAALARAEGGALAERARSALEELDRMRVRAGRGAAQGSAHVPG